MASACIRGRSSSSLWTTITPMTAQRESQLLEAANLLLNARRTLTPIANLPAELIPVSPEETYFIQDRVAEAFGPVGGWKVGAGSLEATPTCGPMPAAWIAASGALLSAENHRFPRPRSRDRLPAQIRPAPARHALHRRGGLRRRRQLSSSARSPRIRARRRAGPRHHQNPRRRPADARRIHLRPRHLQLAIHRLEQRARPH